MSVRQAQKPKVQVSPNEMQATIQSSSDQEYSQWAADDLTTSLTEAGVAITPEVTTRILALLDLIEDDQIPEDEYVLAEGRPPVEPEDGMFEWAEKFDEEEEEEDEEEDRPVNFYEQTSIVTVEKGETIGRIIPATAGQGGLNVKGEEVPTTRTPLEIQLRDSVQRGDDEQTIIARVAGKVDFRRGELRIDEVTAIKGNIDFKCGNIDSSVSVVIHGTIQDKFKVSSKGSITVGGHIEAAEVQAEADVSVRGGILGRNKGTVDAKGEITAKFCDSAHIEAGGDLTFAKEVINSQVTTAGRLFVSHGSIIGGEVHGRDGVEARYLGSEGMIKTTVSAGVPLEILRQAGEIDEKIKKLRDAAAKVREKVAPLMQMLKQLNTEQRAAASELSDQAHLMDFSAAELEEQKQALLEQHSPTEGMDHVLVLNRIYPGVTLRFGDRVVTFKEEKRGPIKIERRQIKNVTEIVTVNQLTGSVFPLKSGRIQIG